MLKIATPLATAFTLAWLLVVPATAADMAEPFRFSIGEASVIAIQDTPRNESDVAIFKDADPQAIQKYAPTGKTPSSINVFLIRSGGKNILVDTGFGQNTPPLLEKSGVNPEAVDVVLITHMHGDHVAGLLKDGGMVYPKARVLIGKTELDYWTGPAASDPARKKNADLAAEVVRVYGDKIKTFAFGDEVLPGITAMNTVGHTPGHTSFLLRSGGDSLLVWGDLVHGAAIQFPRPDISPTYDIDPQQASAVRIDVMQKAMDQNLPIAGAHLPFPGVGRVGQGVDGGKFSYLPGL